MDLINFALAFITYFALIVNYGFDLSATREISINRNNKEKLSNIFSSVIIAKILLFFNYLINLFTYGFLYPKI